jgi:arginyl-tRNA synthetase
MVGDGLVSPNVLGLPIELAEPRSKEHGDLACNIAMIGSKAAGINPREFATLIVERLSTQSTLVASAEIAGPGFINLRLDPAQVAEFVATVRSLGVSGFQKCGPVSHPQKINIEFVSVNPNGPITIGSGRGAAVGSTLCSVLEAIGHEVHREYYINDGVNSEQMRLFAESVKAHCAGETIPENGYKGTYVLDVANKIKELHPDFNTQTTDWYQAKSQELMIAAQKRDLAAFGVTYDSWFSEQSLHDNGQVTQCLDKLLEESVADENPDRTVLKLGKGGVIESVENEKQPNDEPDSSGSFATIWLRSTKFGDDMDRVLRRKDGRLTYIASDVAYHKSKLDRPKNADKMITILGPDHHGYIGRLTAVVGAMEYQKTKGILPCTDPILAALYHTEEERAASATALETAKRKLHVMIYQLVRFIKDGKPAPMRKRDGNIYSLIDLMTEIGENLLPNQAKEKQLEAGKDAARFFYLMRHHDTTFDFDIDLAEKQSDDNPVFYVQYAHARICSVLAKAQTANIDIKMQSNLHLLTNGAEMELVLKVCDLPHELRRIGDDFGVHRLATYCTELAKNFHHFYDKCRVIDDQNPSLSLARAQLCDAVRIALAAGLGLLGVSAPERMDKATL